MKEQILIDHKVLERKAFDIRNEDIYSYFLRFFSEFDFKNSDIIFSYEQNTKNLNEFCKRYNLNEIAGSGSDLQKSCRIMNWVYESLPSGNNTKFLKGCSPVEILEKSKDIKVNCCNHAYVLNVALLACGIFSRCIWCKSMDVSNLEYHVVNVAYIKEYHKWIMLDSSNQVICYNERRIPMDLMELRNAFINNNPINIGTGESKWKGRYVNIREKKYLAYMKKNCFRFSSFLKNSYLQDKENIKIELVPKGYYPSSGERKKIKDSKVLTCYYTTNANDFWKIPL